MAKFTLLFSPTGGTENAANILWDESEVISLLKPCEGRAFTAEDTVLIAVPSYAGRVPTPAAERIRAFSGNGAKAILLCAYGNRQYDNTLSELQDIADACGFVTVAAMAVVTEHSIYHHLGFGRPDDADMEDLQYFKKAIAAAHEPLDPLPGQHGTYHDVHLEAYDPAGTADCTRCGICVSECPVGALNPKYPHFMPNAKCIACMRCIKVCPENARKIAPIAAARIVSFLSPYLNERKPNELFIKGLASGIHY